MVAITAVLLSKNISYIIAQTGIVCKHNLKRPGNIPAFLKSGFIKRLCALVTAAAVITAATATIAATAAAVIAIASKTVSTAAEDKDQNDNPTAIITTKTTITHIKGPPFLIYTTYYESSKGVATVAENKIPIPEKTDEIERNRQIF